MSVDAWTDLHGEIVKVKSSSDYVGPSGSVTGKVRGVLPSAPDKQYFALLIIEATEQSYFNNDTLEPGDLVFVHVDTYLRIRKVSS